ncbi:MAG: cytochrome bd-I oxidase subunit CydX [Legionella sp.]|nr:MAG: cytochrome bd-I oxidase subunit CydX [Legionella sp.]
MWYFSWILGTGLACIFAVMNAVWLELREGDAPTVFDTHES